MIHTFDNHSMNIEDIRLYTLSKMDRDNTPIPLFYKSRIHNNINLNNYDEEESEFPYVDIINDNKSVLELISKANIINIIVVYWYIDNGIKYYKFSILENNLNFKKLILMIKKVLLNFHPNEVVLLGVEIENRRKEIYNEKRI